MGQGRHTLRSISDPVYPRTGSLIDLRVWRPSLTILEVIGYRAVLLIHCWSVLDKHRGYTGIGLSCSVDYKN